MSTLKEQLEHWKNLVDKHAATIDDLRSKCDNLESSLADAIAHKEKAEKAMEKIEEIVMDYSMPQCVYNDLKRIIEQYRSGK